MSKNAERMRELYRGNADAVRLAFDLSFLSNVWDDLIDRDKGIPDSETINRAFFMALVGIPSNPIYVRFAGDLQPLFRLSIINWHVANALQGRKDDAAALEVAHVLRYSLADVLVYIAAIVGGDDWARQVGPEIRMMCQTNRLAEFVEEMRNA